MIGIPRVHIFQLGEVGVIEGGDGLILQGGVDSSALVVHPYLLCLFNDDALLFPGRLPCCYVCRSSWVGWENEGDAGDASILIRWKDEPKVAVLAYDEVTLD